MSGVKCHVSSTTCQVSGVKCQVGRGGYWKTGKREDVIGGIDREGKLISENHFNIEILTGIRGDGRLIMGQNRAGEENTKKKHLVYQDSDAAAMITAGF